jgi:hypothetical protein
MFAVAAQMPAGTVYFVLGSDTSNLDGLSVGTYHCHYTLVMYLDPTQTVATVMSDAYREKLRDSYGTPVRFTWWMMGGNIFRFADNTNVPLANTMTIHTMKQYYGTAIQKYRDEVSLHYHTFTWTDYDGDGIYYWNQAHSFSECRDDFDRTMADYLIEENTYPVAFRSGWHYMDNEWQRVLNERLPYSLHNDWPAQRTTTVEPIDNVYDWSQAPSDFVPFHPSTSNYQIPGDGKGWNDHSRHIGAVSQAMVDTIFAKARRGMDQVVCFWGHLTEADFPANMIKVDSFAHAAFRKYPDVMFRYCTGTEAMQRWRGRTDTIPPVLTFSEVRTGDRVSYTVSSNEPIFQLQPFVAVKDIYEQNRIVPCSATGVNQWKTDSTFSASSIVKAAAAVTDTMGNLSTRFISYLPDDLYVDDRDSGYAEARGTWSSVKSYAAWGPNYRSAVIAPNDSATATWEWSVPQSGQYSVSIQIPATANPVSQISIRLKENGAIIDTVGYLRVPSTVQWIPLFTRNFEAGARYVLEETGINETASEKILTSDVIKFTPLIRQRQIVAAEDFIDMGTVSALDTIRFSLTIMNKGIQTLTISSIHSTAGSTHSIAPFPMQVPAQGSVDVPLIFAYATKQKLLDTLNIISDDLRTPVTAIPVAATVLTYLAVVDNENSSGYREGGTWYYSNAWAYGKTSRYIPVSSAKGAYAQFSQAILLDGWYNIQEIVPKTVNASRHAKYLLRMNGGAVDSVVIDQNNGSQSWMTLFRKKIVKGSAAEIVVSDVSDTLTGSLVLRADAVRFIYIDTVTVDVQRESNTIPEQCSLDQNFPNPCNPVSIIRFSLVLPSRVTLIVYDAIGREVRRLVDGMLPAGYYQQQFDGGALASGVYFYRLTIVSASPVHSSSDDTRNISFIKKLLLLR